MKRYVAALLVVLGLVGVVGVLSVGTGFADDQNAAGAKCSEATLHGTYLFAQDGVDVKGKDQVPFAFAGMEKYDGNGKVKAVVSANFNGMLLATSPSLARIPSKRIAQASSPTVRRKRLMCSSPPMAVCSRSSRSSPPNSR